MTTGSESGYIDVRRKAHQDVARELNAGLPDIWLYRTPHSLIADPQVEGLTKARDVGFGNYQPKTWIGDLWRSQS